MGKACYTIGVMVAVVRFRIIRLLIIDVYYLCGLLLSVIVYSGLSRGTELIQNNTEMFGKQGFQTTTTLDLVRKKIVPNALSTNCLHHRKTPLLNPLYYSNGKPEIILVTVPLPMA